MKRDDRRTMKDDLGVDEVSEAELAAVDAARGTTVARPEGPSYDLDRKLRPAVSLVSAWVWLLPWPGWS